MTEITSSSSARPSVLVIAEAANPDWVSVPLIGWSLTQALRQVADVHLVTQVRNRDAIAARGLVEGQDFTAIDTEAVTRPIWRAGQVLRMGKGKGWTMATAVAGLVYPYFERCVWRQFGPDLRAGRYDLVHRITPLTPTAVSPIAAKCARAGVPFLMGPLNGGVPWPKGFDAERRREREWLSYIRSAYKLAPGRRRMFEASAAILAGSHHTAGEIPPAYHGKRIYLPENAIDPDRFNKRSVQDLTGPLRACFIGRLVPYKGPDMAIEAAADLMRAGKMAFDIVGDGPMRAELEALVAREGLGDAVTFHGQVPHEQVQDIAVSSNILLFPSIREFGGGVVLEAMALGLVPVIVDYAGPGELVVPGTGLKVPIGPRGDIIAALRQQLDHIIAQPDILPALAEAAHTRAHTVFTWPAKARQIADIYDWVLGHRPDSPDPIPGQSL
ncbi:glycosyltransferase family 4 protein [Gymnodinialimonas sp. 2305UL16-5]|uniref:glycosyltransferase family 4 protein n=1 Tax=Gymnodinialimonas mytili TaxID=3126503 RepID=UPI00309B4E94